MEWAVVFATLVGPVLAVQVQKYLDRKREAQQRKEWVFYTLMANRAVRLSNEFVRALNTIDFAFGAGRSNRSETEERIIRHWRDYMHHVRPDQTKLDDPAAVRAWNEKLDVIVVEILQAMADDLRIAFDRETIRSGGYATKAASDQDAEWAAIRQGLVRLMKQEGALPTMAMHPDAEGHLTPIRFPGLG